MMQSFNINTVKAEMLVVRLIAFVKPLASLTLRFAKAQKPSNRKVPVPGP